MTKKLSFVIKTSQSFIRHSEDSFKNYLPQYNSLFEDLTDTYIPLLNMVENLEKENVECRFSLVISPVFCTLMEDENVQNQYLLWLENKILLGQNELERNSDNEALQEIIRSNIKKLKKVQQLFKEDYNKQILKKFAEYHQKGFIELIATCGTDIFIPHFMDLPEVVSAQIEAGLQSYRQTFGIFPDGFWLPELGYAAGVEDLIRAYGYSYTILDARSVLLSEELPSTGLFYPLRASNSLTVFVAEPETKEMIFGDSGFASNPVYRNENHDIGFELPLKSLSPVLQSGSVRYSTGYKYWNKSLSDSQDGIYDYKEAVKQAKKDAKAFLEAKNKVLSKACKCLPELNYVETVCTLDADLLKQSWSEWIVWFEQIMRKSKEYEISMVKCNEMLEKAFTLEKITPYYSSEAGDGYGENLLSSKNCWMMRYVRKASERMIDLSDRFPNDTGLKTRLLNLGAKELMIAQSSLLAKMIENEEFPEYAEKRFKESISAFTVVFDSLGSNTVSTEWLTKLEEKDDLFPWMNYRIFSKKK